MLTIPTTAAGATMTSREIAVLVESRHDSVKRTIERLAASGAITQPPTVDEQDFDEIGRRRLTSVYQIGKRDSYVIVAQLSPTFTARLVDRWQELEQAAPASPNRISNLPPEQQALIGVMLDNADIKVVQAQQGAAIAAIGLRVDEAAHTHLLLSRPAAAESIVHIRERINKLHGLPVRIIDHVLRQSPYALKPFGMVKNEREEAQGGSYAVFWIKDVSAVFARFVRECTPVTATQATHPFIDGRFKLVTRQREVSDA